MVGCEALGGGVRPNNGVFVFGGQVGREVVAVDSDLALFDPGGSEGEVIDVVEEGEGFVDAEHLEGGVVLLFEGLAKREFGNIFTESVRSIGWDIGVHS